MHQQNVKFSGVTFLLTVAFIQDFLLCVTVPISDNED